MIEGTRDLNPGGGGMSRGGSDEITPGSGGGGIKMVTFGDKSWIKETLLITVRT